MTTEFERILKMEAVGQVRIKLLKEIEEGQKAFLLAQESRNSDTKSSAGDKFETGREMMQREMDKISMWIDLNQNHLTNLAKINFDRVSELVILGSLIRTENIDYLLGIGVGRIDIEGRNFFSISPESPIGIQFRGKKVGDLIELMGKKIEIKHII